MPAGFDNDFTQISLDLVGAKSGAKLEGDWEKRVNCGKLLVEMTAAHAAFNRASGTSYEVIFEPDAARFGPKELRGVSIIASTAPTDPCGGADAALFEGDGAGHAQVLQG